MWEYLEKVRGVVKGSLEVKVPPRWGDGKAEMGRVREEKRRGKSRGET